MELAFVKVPAKVKLDTVENVAYASWISALKCCEVRLKQPSNRVLLELSTEAMFWPWLLICKMMHPEQYGNQGKNSRLLGPLPESTASELCWQIEAVSMTSETMLQCARGDCERQQSPECLHFRWSHYKLTSCIIKENWGKLVVFHSTVCLPPTQISASLQ